MKKLPLISAAGLCLALSSTSLYAEVAVVAHKDAKVSEASKSDIVNLFLGKRRHIQGVTAKPIDQEVGSDVRKEFYQKAVGKSEEALNAHWARLLFSGKVALPSQVMDDVEVLEQIAEHPELVGYVRPSSVDDSVKVIMVIP